MTHLMANWPAPRNISALTTTLMGGQSKAPYASNNLALHVGDHATDVLANRHRLKTTLDLPGEPAWLMQTHSTDCVVIEEDTHRQVDASITRLKKQPLAILTADCLPILLCNTAGTEIAAIHAGWRGLLNGIVQNTLKKMQSSPNTLMAWVGPAICQRCFEVGLEVKAQFTTHYPNTSVAFEGRYANLPQMADLILQAAGVSAVYHSNACTFEEKNKFYSYRRESQTGRMATLIWFNDSKET
jgi:YfiH family protein